MGSTFSFFFDISEETKAEDEKEFGEDIKFSGPDEHEFDESRVHSETRRLFYANYGSVARPSIQTSELGCIRGQCKCA